jgi:folylpolyglutamate synthase
LSEGESYRNLAQANSYFGLLPEKAAHPVSTSRVLVEDRALDSYYNVLFSIILFWRVHHVWPEHLTLVSHGFKRRRLVDLHCLAIGFPSARITYRGTDPPLASEEKAKVMVGILQAEKEWTDDPHGVGQGLASKRRQRNVWRVNQKLFLDDEERRRSGLKTEILEDGTETLGSTTLRPR